MTRTSSDALAGGMSGVRRPGFVALIAEGVGDLTSRRRLIRYLVGADMKRTHADTVIGQLWWILDPLMQIAVFYVVFTFIFQRSTPDFLLFLFAAILPWKWFSTTLNDAMNSVVSRQSLIRQLPFPKLVLPTSATLAGTVSFAFGLIALAIVFLFYLHRLTYWVLAIPLIAGVQLVFTLAIATALSAANAFYRDVPNVTGHVLRLWFYLSPVLYPTESLDSLPRGVREVLSLNPFSILLTSYRDVIWGSSNGAGHAPEFVGLGVLLLVSVILLGLAIAFFKRVEPAFARIL